MTFGSKRKTSEGNAGERKPRPVTADWMFRAASHYLERYASTAENLRRVLERKVARRVADLPEPSDADVREAHRAMIEATLARFLELKLLDDRAFAEARFASLRRRGASLRQAEAKLGQKGVDRETIEVVLGADDTGDRTAALAHARRRRLGPYRLRDRAERRDRDIAAMMRAGFGYGDARFAVDAELGDDDMGGDRADRP